MLRSSLLAGVWLAPACAFAQAPPATAPPAAPAGVHTEAEVVVTAQRPRGSPPGDAIPELTLETADVAALGASSIAEILETLSPQTGSARGQGRGAAGGGQPVILINGRRIGSFQELGGIPPEALERVQVFPEDVALQYGFPATQRVINLVLKEAFAASTVEVEAGGAADGARTSAEAEASRFIVDGRGRLSLRANAETSDAVTETDRGVARADRPGQGALRTVAPRQETTGASATYTRNLSERAGFTLDARLNETNARSLLGLAPGGVIERERETQTNRLGLTLDATAARWQWTGTAAHETTDTTTQTRTGGALTQITTSELAETQLIATTNGPLFMAPAGQARGALRLSWSDQALDTRIAGAGAGARVSALGREEALARANLTLPLASRRREVLPALGEVALNLNAAAGDVSDFGETQAWGGGLFWTPRPQARVWATMDHSETAPGLAALGDAPLLTPGSAVFDFVRGETAFVTRVTGGDPALRGETRTEHSLNAFYSPSRLPALQATASYVRTKVDDPVQSISAVTPVLAAAFPERFVRDGRGMLTLVDQRPVNGFRQETTRLRWSLSFTYSGGAGQASGPAPRSGPQDGRPAAPQGASSGRPPQAGPQGGPPGAGGVLGGPPPWVRMMGGQGTGQGGGGRGGPGAAAGFFQRDEGDTPGRRFSLSLSHAWVMEDDLTLSAGGPALSQISGPVLDPDDATRRHTVEFEGGGTVNGVGLRVNGRWRSGWRVDGAAGPGGAGDLRFGDTLTANLRAFVAFNQRPQLVRAYPFLARSRLTLRVNNVFDTAQAVTDAQGRTPEAYQKGLVAPLGRSWDLEFRKQF